VATAWRWVSGAVGRASEPFGKFRRGGTTVALLGLDGAGKSTLAERLATTYGTPTRPVYMGLWRRGDGPARPPFQALDIALRPVRIWARYLVGQIYRASGYLVIFDRYTYDAAIPPRGGHVRLKRAYFWLLSHSVPAPDLTILLDAPIDILDARKPEAASDDRSLAAAALRKAVERLSNGVIIDASRSSDAVLADVTSMIWQRQVRRWGTVEVDRGSGFVRRFDASILAPVALGRRRMISAQASRTPKDLQAVVSELQRQRVLEQETVSHMIVTDTGVRVAWMAVGDDPPSLLLKLGQRGQDHALLAHAAAVERLRSDERLVALDSALPRIRSSGRLDDVAYVVEEPLPGVRGDRLIRDRRVRSELLVAAAEWIGTLHERTRERRVVDDGLIEAWIDRPAAAIAELVVGRADARRRTRALARLAASLREDLTGQPVDLGWVHGDYWAGNLLATPDGTRVLGVVDWDLAGRPELPLHDILHLILYARRLNGDLELGEIVASALDRPDWDVTERLILERCSLGWPVDADGARRAIALSWLRHVGAFAGDGSHGANRIWLRRNVDPVLDR
jgi:thymidylate kinase